MQAQVRLNPISLRGPGGRQKTLEKVSAELINCMLYCIHRNTSVALEHNERGSWLRSNQLA